MDPTNRAYGGHVGPVGVGGFAGAAPVIGHGAVGVGAIPLGAITPTGFTAGNPLVITPFHHTPGQYQQLWNYGQPFSPYSYPYGNNPAYSTYGNYPYY